MYFCILAESPSVPVGVVSLTAGSQLIELLQYDKEFIGVSEMVGVVHYF